MTGFDATFLHELPSESNLSTYYLDRNLDEGRADKVAVRVGEEARTYRENPMAMRRSAVYLPVVYRTVGI